MHFMKEMIIILILHLMILLWDLLLENFLFMDIYILTYYDQKSINLEYDIKYDYSKRFSFRKRNFFFLILWLLMVMDFEINGLDKTCLGAVKSESTLLLKI